MRRRHYLAIGGTGTLGAIAGCTGALEDDECTPGSDPVSEIELDFAAYTEDDRYTDETYHVQGTVVEQSSTRVVIDDGTSLAAVSVASSEYVFDTEEFDIGDCISGSGSLHVPRSGQHEIPYVGLEPEEIEFGSSEKDVSSLPDRPDQTISSDYNGLDEEITVTVTGAAEIPSDQLLIRWREYESETPWTEADREWWHELTDVPPGEPIPDGSQFTRATSSFDYSAFWLSGDRGWSRELDQLRTNDIR
ncbi:hypothetical protein [Natrinema sp. SYSU A 869]|uniref:hypothetical protein n=1 Tax=Natrinema sp. SYSU A 869 TaxID=2871694 RepID=UPI001CA3FD3F|nr:hypothetical protein [Natrinema sp. SYSU A 869]